MIVSYVELKEIFNNLFYQEYSLSIFFDIIDTDVIFSNFSGNNIFQNQLL